MRVAVLNGHHERSAVPEVQDVHLEIASSQQGSRDVIPVKNDRWNPSDTAKKNKMKKRLGQETISPSVSHSLDERVLAVPALEVDVQLGPHEEVVHGLLVAAPDGVGQGGRAVVRGEVDVHVWDGQ